MFPSCPSRVAKDHLVIMHVEGCFFRFEVETLHIIHVYVLWFEQCSKTEVEMRLQKAHAKGSANRPYHHLSNILKEGVWRVVVEIPF